MADGSLPLPGPFLQRAIDLHAAAGEDWVRRLPTIIASCARQWSLSVGTTFQLLSYSYVVPAMRADGTRAVLKIGFPDQALLWEAEALRLFVGQGAARLLAADLEQGALLLERLEPGASLDSLDDDEAATAIAARVMSQLWRPVPAEHSFPSVTDWAADLGQVRKRFGGRSSPQPIALVDQADALFAELTITMGEPVLLHGDLHHGNILSASRQPWLAIDPKGVVGEPAYEVGALLRNPMPHLLNMDRPDRVLARRIEQLSDHLELDRVQVRGWALAQAVLAAWWALEDHGRGWEPWIACAELLAAL